jgi:hypothetical protein
VHNDSIYAWGCKLGYLNLSHRVSAARWWIICKLRTLAAIGTHYYPGLIVLWQGRGWLAGLALLRKDNSRQALMSDTVDVRGCGDGTCIDAGRDRLALRWTSRSVIRPHLPGYLVRVAAEFGAWPGVEERFTAAGALTCLVLVGAVAGRARPFCHGRHPAGDGLPASSQLFILLAAFPYSGPVCYLLASRGVMVLKKSWLIALLAAVMVGVTGPGLARIYNKPIDEAEDARPLMNQIRAAAQAGDAVLTTYIWQDGYLISYVPKVRLTSFRSSYNAHTVPDLMEEIFRQHERLWVFNYEANVHDTYNRSMPGCTQHCAGLTSSWQHALALFVHADPLPVTWGHAAFERGITLYYAPLSRRGNTLGVTLRWQTVQPLNHTYKVFVHLRRSDGEPIAQSDSEPAGGFDPTDTWQPGQLVLDRRALLVPRDTPLGTYAVYAGLYDPEDGSRLQVMSPSAGDTSDSVLIGRADTAGRSN